MVWTTASLGLFEPVEGIEEKLINFTCKRKDGKFTLRSIIQMSPTRIGLPEGVKVISGLVIDECVRTAKHIKEEEGKWIIEETKPFKDIRWADFWLTTKSICLAQGMGSRGFTFRVISQALAGTDDHVHPVKMDIMKIADDHKKNWIGQIIERKGHWHGGIVYGDDLRKDNVIGKEYIKCQKAQVGFITKYFGAPVKVRVTKDGTIMVLTKLDNDMGKYIQFIRMNLLSYASPI